MTRRLSWWLWLANALALGAGLAGWAPGLRVATVLGVLQVVHQGVRTRGLWALSVQLRILNLGVILLGSLGPALRPLQVLQLGGMAVRVVFDYCLGGRLLSLLPWNRRRPLTLELVLATFSPAVTAVPAAPPACPSGGAPAAPAHP